MKISKFEIIIISIALVLSIIESISFAFAIRIVGQNALNARLWQYIIVALLLVSDKSLLNKKSMIILYVYSLVYFVLEYVGHYDLQSDRVSRYVWMYYQHFSLGLCILLREYVLNRKSNQVKGTIVNVIILSYMIAFILNIIAVLANPYAVRGFVSKANGLTSQSYRSQGLAGYGFASSVPFIIPIAVYKLKRAKGASNYLRRIFWILFISIAIVSSYLSVYIAPLILSVVLLFLALLGRRRLRVNSVVVVVLLIAYVVTPKGIIGDLLRDTGVKLNNFEIERKFEDLAEVVEGGMVIEEGIATANSIEGRASRIDLNINRFFKSPLIGQGTSSEGEHIYWLNLLAQYGVIGTVPLLMLIIYSWRRDFSYLSDDYKFFYFLSIFGFIALGFMKAVQGVHMFMIPFLLAPIISEDVL